SEQRWSARQGGVPSRHPRASAPGVPGMQSSSPLQKRSSSQSEWTVQSWGGGPPSPPELGGLGGSPQPATSAQTTAHRQLSVDIRPPGTTLSRCSPRSGSCRPQWGGPPRPTPTILGSPEECYTDPRMFGIGMGEMAVIAVLLLIAVGPDKLPSMV